MSKWDNIRKYLSEKRHHRRKEDRRPFIYGKMGEPGTFLKWHYDDNRVCVHARDYALIHVIEEAIKIYLEGE